MSKIFFLLSLSFMLLGNSLIISEEKNWTEGELLKANTAKNISQLNEAEKEAILYLNLARLYPKKFNQIEVINYFGPSQFGNYLKNSKYRTSLIKHLNRIKPMEALSPRDALNLSAKCFAKEMGVSGYVGHTRKKCKKSNYAECCSYGMPSGKDVILQLLIDHDVPSLGHRIACLNPNYERVGVGNHSHKTHQYCCVIELI